MKTFSDAKTKIIDKAAPDTLGNTQACEECGTLLPPRSHVVTGPGGGEKTAPGIRIDEDRYVCVPCHTALYAKQYMPAHPKADRNGYVRLSDLFGDQAPKRPGRLKIKPLPYDKDDRMEDWT